MCKPNLTFDVHITLPYTWILFCLVLSVSCSLLLPPFLSLLPSLSSPFSLFLLFLPPFFLPSSLSFSLSSLFLSSSLPLSPFYSLFLSLPPSLSLPLPLLFPPLSSYPNREGSVLVLFISITHFIPITPRIWEKKYMYLFTITECFLGSSSTLGNFKWLLLWLSLAVIWMT